MVPKKLIYILLILLNSLIAVFIILLSTKYLSIHINEDTEKHDNQNWHGHPALSPYTEVDCSSINRDNLMVAMVFGQSNSANYGETRHDSSEKVYMLSGNKCYKAKDPLKGADGFGGSVWSRLGDKIIANGLYENVIFLPIGVGGSGIDQWARNKDRRQALLNSIEEAKANNLRITHILFHQGESDGRIYREKGRYKLLFNEMLSLIRSNEVKAPFYISIATYCKDSGHNPEIQTAQRELVSKSRGILMGPNTDLIVGDNYRYDKCHFSEEGLELFAEMWLRVLRK